MGDFTNNATNPLVGTVVWEMPNHLSTSYPVTVSNTVVNS